VNCFRYMFFVLTRVIHLQRRERGLAGSPHALQAPRVSARVRNLRLRLPNEGLQRAYKVCNMKCQYIVFLMAITVEPVRVSATCTAFSRMSLQAGGHMP